LRGALDEEGRHCSSYRRGRGDVARGAQIAAQYADDTIAVEPVVDRDTQGIPGAPDIASTIFAKITVADVFVADVSIIVRNENRATPNPNVLIELGYALKTLGHERVVLVFNEEFGRIEELPFDLRTRRVLAYRMPAEGTPKGPERKILQKQFDAAIRAALARYVAPDATPTVAVAAIENQLPNRIIILRRDLEGTLKSLDELRPRMHSQGGTVGELLKGLASTQEVIAGFTKVVETISLMVDAEASMEMLRWFGRVFDRYNRPEGLSGMFSNADQDYFKFLGHEMFVTFVATLIQERRWSLIERILVEPIPMRYLEREQGAGSVDWRYASEHLPSILDESRKKSRTCLHADTLNERDTSGGLAAVMPMDDFMAADYFLFLLGEMSTDPGVFMEWRPWSAMYLKRTPAFLRNAESTQVAAQIMKIFNISNPEEFKRRLIERAPRLEKLFSSGHWMDPFRPSEAELFGTR